MTEYASDWAHPTYDEGGVLAPGVTMYHNGGAHIPILAAEQVERGLAWIRDNYRDGSFRCPSGGAKGGDAPGDPASTPPVVTDGESLENPPDYNG